MRTTLIALLVTFLSLCVVGQAMAQAAPKDQTIEDLQAAFTGESNAAAKYQAFAAKADEEGYAQVASVFRAASRAETIHAQNHASVLKSLGAEAQAKMETPKVLGTGENLKAAIQGESQERDEMYPKFINNARSAKLAAAVRTFNFAMAAEAEHAKLYTAMLGGLDQGKQQAKTQMYVCPVCGFTAMSVAGKCPSCFTAKEKFEVIS